MLWRLSKYLLVFVTAAFALAVGAAAWLVYSESGARWSVSQLDGLTDRAVRITGVEGTLASGLRFHQLSYSDPGLELRASDVALRVDLWSLLVEQVRVEHLEIGQLVYFGKEGAETNPDSDGSFSLPVSLFVPEARLGRFVIRGDSDEVVEQIRLSAVWAKGDTIQIESVSGRIRDVNIDAYGRIVLASEVELRLDAQWSMLLDDIGLEGSGSAEGALSLLNIQHELLRPYPVHTKGTLGLTGTPVARLTSSSDQIDFDVAGESVSLQNVLLRIDGWIEQYDASWESGVAFADMPLANVIGSGNGNLEALTIDSAELELDDSRLQLSGELEWLPTLRWRSHVNVANLDPALVIPDWTGSLDGSLSVAGSLLDSGPVFDVTDIEINGELRGQPLSVRGSVSKDAVEWRVSGLRATSRGNHVAVNGKYGERFDFDYDLKVIDLSLFGEGWSGSVVGKGRVGGTPADLDFETDTQIVDLSVAGFSIASATARGRLASTGPASDLMVEANGIRAGGHAIESLRANIQGVVEDHRLSIAIDTGELSIEAALSGAWTDSLWTGEMLSSKIRLGRFGNWRQSESSSLGVAQDRIEIEQLCWREDDSTACVAGSAARDAIDIDARLSDLSFEQLAHLLPAGISVSGTVNVSAEIRGSEAAPAISYSAYAETIDLTYLIDPDENLIETSIRDFRASGDADLNRIGLEMTMNSTRQGQFALNGLLTDWRSELRVIDASLSASLPDASFLAVLTTEVSNFAASVEADLSLQGALSAPTMRGGVVLRDGHADLGRAGITLEDIEIEARPAGSHRIAITARARSGAGHIDADGYVDLDAAAGWPVTARIVGDDFQALDLTGFDVVVSPDVEVTGSADTLRLKGKVATPRAIIELRELPEQAVELSPDVTVYRHEETELLQRSVLKVYADLDLELGKEVSFSGFGLTTALAGGLAIHSEPGRVAEGRGIIDITSGKFEAYGQELDITRGRLIFTGALDNPTLDVDARRKVDDVTVGLRLSGTSNEPVASVFSDPAMSETDALSYLVVGRVLSETSSTENNNVGSAAAALGLKQVMDATSGFGEAVGLDEFGLDSDNTSTGAIMAGKQVTPDLHLRYSYGVFNRIGALLLRYRLNRRLSLEARSAEDQSMDLIYSHEKK